MGAGKTTVGKLLAKQLGKSFYDADHEIEKRMGVKVSVIFELEGEEGFRKREAAVIKDLVIKDNIVLATGGGAVLSEANREALTKHGKVIYLQANVTDLSKRMRHDKQRPLLQNVNLKDTLQTLYTKRNPIYLDLADLVVETGKQPASALVKQIKKQLNDD